MAVGEKRMFLSLIRIFSHDFCMVKNSSLLPIPKPNALAIKENCEEKTCECRSYPRMAFLLMEAI